MNKQNKKVSIILPNPQYDRKIRAQLKLLKVAAYCRVSTILEQQETSYESQIGYYTEKITSNPNWKFAGVFADDGKSATNTKKRCDFNSMIDKCMAGKIDMIITKSVSRFARNTVDCLQIIRKLKEHNIGVLFEKENIYTLENTGELLITILSSQAQEESRNLSENTKWGIVRQYEKGVVNVNYKKFMGYTKSNDGELVVVPEEAEVVRKIFHLYLLGNSLAGIAKILQEQSIKTVTGKIVWNPTVISKMLANEKYCGDARLQKTYTVDFLTKKRVINHGLVPQYYIEDNHEPIISKEIFLQAQAERIKRSDVPKLSSKRKGKYSSKYALSNIMFCKECGYVYHRVIWSKGGKKKVVWRCVNRLKHGTNNCRRSPSLDENKLHSAIIECIKNIIEIPKSTYPSILQSNIKEIFKAYTKKESLSSIDEYDDVLVRLLIQSIIVKEGSVLEIRFKSGITVECNL